MAKLNKGKHSKSDSKFEKSDEGPIELNIEDGEFMKKNDSAEDSKKSDPLGDKLLFDEPSDKKSKHVEEEHDGDDEDDDDKENKYINLEDMHSDKAKSKSEKSDYIHVKIPKLNIIWAERIAYWVIIIVMLILVFKAPVGKMFSTDHILGSINDNNEAASNDVTVPTSNASQTTANSSANQSPPAVNNTPANTVPNVTKPIDKTCSAGTPSIEITSVIMDDKNDKKVVSVKAKIINSDSDDLEDYYLDLTWWNKDDLSEGLGLDTKQRLKVTGTAKYMAGDKTVAKCGGTYLMNLDDELTLPYVTSRDTTNTVKLILRNGAKKEITSSTYTIKKV